MDSGFWKNLPWVLFKFKANLAVHMKLSANLESVRARYQPKTPPGLAQGGEAQKTEAPAPVSQAVGGRFPNTFNLPSVTFSPAETKDVTGHKMRVGVILSGGPAPGGHNVIAGLFDGIKSVNGRSSLVGFLNGPAGLLNNAARELEESLVDSYRNTGGFDLIGSGRTKLETEEHFLQALETARRRELTGLVVVGGDDSNTNACILAEFARQQGSPLCVVGVPKTIDGDLKGPQIEASFGFDTACKVYGEIIGNIHRDALSVRKYWHFIKLMGRSASHIALECALQTRPTITLISEEIQQRGLALHEIVDHIAQVICERGNRGENFGTVLIPEGIVEFIPEMGALIRELNEALVHHSMELAALDTLPHKREFIVGCLSSPASGLFRHLPREIANQLILDRDPHGNVQVAKIDTQRLFLELVENQLHEMTDRGIFKGAFSSHTHYLGYEGRCAAPSNFDANYGYSLGLAAALLLRDGFTGMIATVRNLARPAEEWVAGGTPLARLMELNRRHGADVPVIRKALVDLDGPVFQVLKEHRDGWAKETQFAFPGPLQYFGPAEVCDQTTMTLQLESGGMS
jgi:pyrophosphate--fructose-6-phosphate 1-phosphotransferase